MLVTKPDCERVPTVKLRWHLSDLVTEISSAVPTWVHPREASNQAKHSLFLLISGTSWVAERHSMEDGPG